MPPISFLHVSKLAWSEKSRLRYSIKPELSWLSHSYNLNASNLNVATANHLPPSHPPILSILFSYTSWLHVLFHYFHKSSLVLVDLLPDSPNLSILLLIQCIHHPSCWSVWSLVIGLPQQAEERCITKMNFTSLSMRRTQWASNGKKKNTKYYSCRPQDMRNHLTCLFPLVLN